MELAPDWKSLWPVSSTFSAPLLVQNKKQETSFGPLSFNPEPDSSITLLHSPALSPRLPPQYPQLSFSRFLKNYNTAHSSASSISSLFGVQIPDFSSYFHGLNSLQLLQIPDKKLVVVFFPTGENSDRVGFSLLTVRDGILKVNSQMENLFHVVKGGTVNHQRVTLLLVNPVEEFCFDENGEDKCKIATVGFLMVCTHYSVYWYRIGMFLDRQSEYSVCLDYLGCASAKILRGSIVVSACWSPHSREECLVLLENGQLLLFDVYSSIKGRVKSIFSPSVNFNGAVNKVMQVSLTNKLELEKEKSTGENRHWFKCEFSWHPRVLIASHGTEVFLVDLRSPGDCNISSLLKLEMFSRSKNDQFVALSRAGSDGFSFTVATEFLLLLCDVRKPPMPVLRWTHGVQNPRYMTVFGLSDLRANAEDAEYMSASESGYCIMLGSFWDNGFSIFCYGPRGNNLISNEISNLCNSWCAWGLPSELSMSCSTCKCGSCLEREEFTDTSLPIWIDWRQKRSMILGFGILHADLSAQLSSVNSRFGGFVLMNLSSSGILEAHYYHAAWEPNKFSKAGHKRKSICLEESIHLYDRNHPEYDGVKKFQHFKLEFLNAFLKGKIEKYIVRRREKIEDGYEGSQRRLLVKSNSDFHQEVCRKLKDFGLPEARSSFSAATLLRDINLPTSIHDIALRSMFSALPTNLMQFAFSAYSDFNENPESPNEPLLLLDIPHQPQVPPFPFRKSSHRSNRWSSKVQPSSSALVGPTVPPLFLTTLHKLRMEELKEKRDAYPEDSEAISVHAQFKHLCDKVMEVVEEQFPGLDEKTRDMDFVSLADDFEYKSSATPKLKFSCHEPSAFRGSTSSGVFSTHVFRRSQEMASDFSPEMVGEELFDVGCPVELKFDKCIDNFGSNETFQKLKRRELAFQRSFKPYQDYITRLDE